MVLSAGQMDRVNAGHLLPTLPTIELPEAVPEPLRSPLQQAANLPGTVLSRLTEALGGGGGGDVTGTQ